MLGLIIFDILLIDLEEIHYDSRFFIVVNRKPFLLIKTSSQNYYISFTDLDGEKRDLFSFLKSYTAMKLRLYAASKYIVIKVALFG